MSSEFFAHFPNITICDDCPLRFWTSLSCNLENDTLMMDIETSIVDRKRFILRADPFGVGMEINDQVWLHRYIGKRFVVFDERTNCSHNPRQDILSDGGVRFQLRHVSEQLFRTLFEELGADLVQAQRKSI